MKVARHRNPITQHNRNVLNQLPNGASGHKQRFPGVKAKGQHGRCRTYVGVNLVRWYLTNDMKKEARELLQQIKEGTINPRTGEKI